jgi:hypothetical protein
VKVIETGFCKHCGLAIQREDWGTSEVWRHGGGGHVRCYISTVATPGPRPYEARPALNKAPLGPAGCTICGAPAVYLGWADSYACRGCNQWLEAKCDDPACPFCPARPASPWVALTQGVPTS